MCPSWQYAWHTTATYTILCDSPPATLPLLIPSATEIGNKSSLPAASQGKFTFLAILAVHLAPPTWPTGGPTKYVANYSKNRRFYVHFRLGLHLDTVSGWL